MALSALAELVAAPRPGVDVSVTGVTLRSASVRPGDLYAALPGARTHGSEYVAEAAVAGAVAVLTDPAGAVRATTTGLPVVVVPDPRAVLGPVSAAIYASAGAGPLLIGVTGTQGKTTTTHLLAAALSAAGRRTAVIGTMGTWIDGERVPTALTTPEAPDLHALFAVMRERGVEVCAMEVSSHSLVLHRVNGVRFDVAVFLNFGRDHLDFHPDVEHYFAAKASLFEPSRARRALLNADDPAVAALVQALAARSAEHAMPVRTFSSSSSASSSTGTTDWWCTDVRLGAEGTTFTVHGPDGLAAPVTSHLVGAFNVENALAALAAAGEAGFDVGAAAAALASVASVEGRLERISEGQDFAVVVDYAHKPDAVTAALEAMRAVTTGRLWVVLGAGGDRDAGKRELMGEAAASLADVVIVTDDNPRTEDPAVIRAALLAGAGRGAAARSDGRVELIEVAGRRAAIERALTGAAAGDTVLIAGKGHESGQQVGDTVVPFDDRVVARQALARRRSGAGAT